MFRRGAGADPENNRIWTAASRERAPCVSHNAGDDRIAVRGRWHFMASRGLTAPARAGTCPFDSVCEYVSTGAHRPWVPLGPARPRYCALAVPGPSARPRVCAAGTAVRSYCHRVCCAAVVRARDDERERGGHTISAQRPFLRPSRL